MKLSADSLVVYRTFAERGLVEAVLAVDDRPDAVFHQELRRDGADELAVIGREDERVVAARADRHVEARLGESLADKRGDLFFVFDDEEAHPESVGRR